MLCCLLALAQLAHADHPPTPSYHKPAPAYHPPAQTYHKPAIIFKKPAPAYHTPAPAYHAPAPAYHAPAPAYHAPAPTYKEPAHPYSYSYGVHDDYSGNHYNAGETSDGSGNVEGSYSVALPDGRTQHINYHANH